MPEPLQVSWIHGSPSSKHSTDPDIQVFGYDEDTFILRQDMAVHYEAPFMFLLFGQTRAVLLDTGATASAELFPLRAVVDDVVGRWLRDHPRDGYQLLVLHTHTHADHVAGDDQLRHRPDTVVVGADLDTAWSFFDFHDDPDRVAEIDLGGRVLECLATPGHDAAAVTYFDPRTGFLLTGDTVYPGRLYIEDWAAFGRTIDRLVAFAQDRPVTYVLGCHIEMAGEPGVDYPVLTSYQPDEPPLEMSVDRLQAIRSAIEEVGDRPGRHAFPDFVLCRDDT